MKRILKWLMWGAIALPLCGFAQVDQWRDTLYVDNAIIHGLDTTSSSYYAVGVDSATGNLYKVVSSDGSGSPTRAWWSKTGNYLYPSKYLFDSVGIGINTPTEILEVDGNIAITKGGWLKYDTAYLLRMDVTNMYGGTPLSKSITGEENTIFGYKSGMRNISGDDNTGLGSWVFYYLTSGVSNTSIGAFSGFTISTGNYNTALGAFALTGNNGSHNTSIGYLSMANNSTGNYNTSLGSGSLYTSSSGSNSVAVGYQSGYQAGSGSVMLGYQAGFNETGSNKLYIDNSSTTDPLIYGDFDNDWMHVNDSLSVGDGTNNVVLGSSEGIVLSGTTTVWDDLRVTVNAVKLSGSKPPTWTSYKGGEVLAFSDQAVAGNQEVIYFTVQLPHTWKAGSDIEPHIHWVGSTTSTDTVVWELTYSWANIQGQFPSETTIEGHGVPTATADYHQYTAIGEMSGTGKTESSMIICSLKRKSADASDTFTGSAYLLEIDFHHEIEKMGSKNEIPD